MIVSVSPSMQTSMTDSEYNLDPNCLSRCSTELFSEASWEQVDKQDTEVSSQANRKLILGKEGTKLCTHGLQISSEIDSCSAL